MKNSYIIQNKLLKRYVTDGDKTYETIMLPRALTAQILKMAHDNLGHNGTHRTYMLLKRLYYWKGLKPSVTKHIQKCYQCQRRNKQVVKYRYSAFRCGYLSNAIHLYGFDRRISSSYLQRKEICIDSNMYAYRLCILYTSKNQNCQRSPSSVYRYVYSKFGGSVKILSDNGTEFKNKIFEQVAKELGVVYKLYTPPYHPASNGRIEGFHAFLKA